MRFFYDSEFIEDGTTIELISIGVVGEDGREFYAVSTEFDSSTAGPWVRRNVLPKLPNPSSAAWMSRARIRDELYDFVFVRGFRAIGNFFWKICDVKIIDGLGPNGAAWASLKSAARLAKIQSGYVYHYAFVMLIGVAALATGFGAWSAQPVQPAALAWPSMNSAPHPPTRARCPAESCRVSCYRSCPTLRAPP